MSESRNRSEVLQNKLTSRDLSSLECDFRRQETVMNCLVIKLDKSISVSHNYHHRVWGYLWNGLGWKLEFQYFYKCLSSVLVQYALFCSARIRFHRTLKQWRLETKGSYNIFSNTRETCKAHWIIISKFSNSFSALPFKRCCPLNSLSGHLWPRLGHVPSIHQRIY